MVCNPWCLVPRYSAFLHTGSNWRADTLCTRALWQGPPRQSGAASESADRGGAVELKLPAAFSGH